MFANKKLPQLNVNLNAHRTKIDGIRHNMKDQNILFNTGSPS